MRAKLLVLALALVAAPLLPAVPTALAFACAPAVTPVVCAETVTTAGPTSVAGVARYTAKGQAWALAPPVAATMETSRGGSSSCTSLTTGTCETEVVAALGPYGCITAATRASNVLLAVWDHETRCYGSGLGADPVGLALAAVADAESGLHQG